MPATPTLRIPAEIVMLIRAMHPDLKKRVKSALERIIDNPLCGKPLKEELAGLYSFRVRRFRIIYKLTTKKHIDIVAVGPRKSIYEETFKIISKQIRAKPRG